MTSTVTHEPFAAWTFEELLDALEVCGHNARYATRPDERARAQALAQQLRLLIRERLLDRFR